MPIPLTYHWVFCMAGLLSTQPVRISPGFLSPGISRFFFSKAAQQLSFEELKFSSPHFPSLPQESGTVPALSWAYLVGWSPRSPGMGWTQFTQTGGEALSSQNVSSALRLSKSGNLWCNLEKGKVNTEHANYLFSCWWILQIQTGSPPKSLSLLKKQSVNPESVSCFCYQFCLSFSLIERKFQNFAC